MSLGVPRKRKPAAPAAEKFPGYNLRMQLAAAFKARRAELGMTQQAAAAEIGICVSTVRRIERVSTTDVDLRPLLAALAWLDMALVLRPIEQPSPDAH